MEKDALFSFGRVSQNPNDEEKGCVHRLKADAGVVRPEKLCWEFVFAFIGKWRKFRVSSAPHSGKVLCFLLDFLGGKVAVQVANRPGKAISPFPFFPNGGEACNACQEFETYDCQKGHEDKGRKEFSETESSLALTFSPFARIPTHLEKSRKQPLLVFFPPPRLYARHEFHLPLLCKAVSPPSSPFHGRTLSQPLAT